MKNRDYREKTIDGMIVDMHYLRPCPLFTNVTVRMTSDERGQSLSLTCANIMIEIPLESVADIIKVAEGVIRNDHR